MAGENNGIVEDIERIDISGGGAGDAPATDDTSEDDESDAADTGAEGDGKPEQIVHKDPPAPATTTDPVAVPLATDPTEIKRLSNETDREYALRLEVTNLKAERRRDRVAEITGDIVPPGTPAKKQELTDAQKEIIGKYKPEELAALRDVLPILAKEMGFVRAEELEQTSYASETQTQLDAFIEKHPEYLPENDPGNVMWERFKAEFAQYRQPANARDYAKLFAKAHREVFGIQAAGTLSTDTAARTKVEVASHAGAPASPAARSAPTRTAAPTGARFDMLKGFTPEEIAEITGE